MRGKSSDERSNGGPARWKWLALDGGPKALVVDIGEGLRLQAWVVDIAVANRELPSLEWSYRHCLLANFVLVTSWSLNTNTDIKDRDVNASKQTGWLLTSARNLEKNKFWGCKF